MYNADHYDVQLSVARDQLVQQHRARNEKILRAGLFPFGPARAWIANVLRCDEGDRSGLVFGSITKPPDDAAKVALISEADDGRNE